MSQKVKNVRTISRFQFLCNIKIKIFRFYFNIDTNSYNGFVETLYILKFAITLSTYCQKIFFNISCLKH